MDAFFCHDESYLSRLHVYTYLQYAKITSNFQKIFAFLLLKIRMKCKRIGVFPRDIYENENKNRQNAKSRSSRSTHSSKSRSRKRVSRKRSIGRAMASVRFGQRPAGRGGELRSFGRCTPQIEMFQINRELPFADSR